jgi:photosystem II stability/assembly factor-like uncharacterized protein
MKKLLFLFLLIPFLGLSQKVVENYRYDTTRNFRALVKKNDDLLKRTGRGRGKGDKQYERWKYENNFRTLSDGYIAPTSYDQTQYLATYPTAVPLSSDWEELGPKEWNRTSSWNPGIGRITGIAISYQNPNVIYISSPGGGIWKTTNGGTSWVPLTDNNAAWMDMASVAVDPLNDNIVYAGSMSSSQLIKSTDGGTTWTSIGRLLNSNVSKILINPSNTSNIIACSNGGIVRTTDGGVTWTKTYAVGTEDLEFKPSDPNIVYASSAFAPSILRSTDNGITWTALTSTEGIVFSSRTLLAVTPADPNKVYAVQANGVQFGRLYVSNNSGASFTTAVVGSSSTCTNYFGYETSGCGANGQAGYDMAIAVNPTNANDIYIGGINIWRSTNGGSSFSPLTQWSLPLSGSFGYVHADIHALEFSGTTLYSGSDGGIYKRTSTSWQDLSKGLGIRQFYRASIKGSKFMGGAQDNGSSVYTYRWSDWLGADGTDNAFISDAIIIGASQYGQLYRSVDTGKTYTTLPKPANGAWVSPILYVDGKLYVGLTGGIYTSSDNGSTWIKLPLTVSGDISSIAISGNYIYASQSINLYRSYDAGSTWASTALPSTINRIAISSNDPTTLYVALNSTANRVFKSSNAGVSFTDMSLGLPAIQARSIVEKNDTVYVGLNLGVYRNVSGTWTNITNNLPYSGVNDLDLEGQYIYASTYGRGLWRLPITTTVEEEITPVLTTPSLTASGNESATHNLSWSFTTNQTVDSVNIMQSTNGTTWAKINQNTSSSGSYTASSRSTDVSYFYRVNAYAGNLSSQSDTVGLKGPASVTYTISTVSLTGSRTNQNLHTLNWSFTTNDAIQSVVLKQSLDGITYNTINTSVSASGSYQIQTSASRTYYYRVDVTTTNLTKSSSVLIIKNPKKGR